MVLLVGLSQDVTREQLITQLGNLVQVSDEVSAQIEEGKTLV